MTAPAGYQHVAEIGIINPTNPSVELVNFPLSLRRSVLKTHLLASGNDFRVMDIADVGVDYGLKSIVPNGDYYDLSIPCKVTIPSGSGVVKTLRVYHNNSAATNGETRASVSGAALFLPLGATPPTGGTWTITYDGSTTTGIPWNCTPTDIDTALKTLPGNSGSTIVGCEENYTQWPIQGGEFHLLFAIGLGNVAQITVTSYLTGGAGITLTPSTLVEGVEGETEEQQAITLSWLDVTDWTGNRTPANSGVTAGTGTFGETGVFNGSSGITLNSELAYNDAVPWSVAFMARQHAFGGYQGFYGDAFSAGHYTRLMDTDTSLYWVDRTNDNQAWFDLSRTADVSYHIVLACDGANVIKAYMNGQLLSATLAHTATANDILSIGGAGSGNYLFNGQLGDFSVWSSALPLAWIQALYAYGLDGTYLVQGEEQAVGGGTTHRRRRLLCTRAYS